MPAPTLHLTFAALAVSRTELPAELVAAGERAPYHLRLGALLPDLPYYVNPALVALGYGLRLPALPSRWGALIHSGRPGAWVANVIEATRRSPLSRDEGRALVLGLLSHVALDLELHPLVNECARRERATRGGFLSHHHYLAEKHQSLFFHLDRFGEDLLGSPRFFRERGRLLGRRALLLPRAPRALVDLFRGSLARTFGAAPPRLRVSSWLRNFHQLAWLLSMPACRWNGRRSATSANRRRYYEGAGIDFAAAYAAAERRLFGLAPLGLDCLDGAPPAAARRARFEAEAAIDDLADPRGRRGQPASAMPIAEAARAA